MKILSIKDHIISDAEIDKIVDTLSNGGVIIYPTDTVYGIGCNAFDKKAVEKVFDIKNKDKNSNVSVLVDSIDTIKKYAVVGEMDENFLNNYLPGQVTVILKLKKEVLEAKLFADNTINNNGATGFRVIKSPEIMKDICKRCSFPLVTTSASKSKSGLHETSVNYIMNQFANNVNDIDIFIDSGDLGVSKPSTVVDLTATPFKIVRMGERKL